MRKLFFFSMVAIAMIFMASFGAQGQDDKWNNNPPRMSKTASAPAPRHDLTGIWAAQGGAGAKGTREYPDDKEHVGHDVPYTAAGKAARAKNKANEGEQQVPAGLSNDPWNICDPEGYPRMLLFELRVMEFSQTPTHVIFLDQFNSQYRIIWTDGRQLPQHPDPRWNGYSIGKWEDDYTFVVQSNGTDERTWLDNVGRPHSDALQVEERWHRVDHDNMELTVIINDPKYYTQPWMALNKMPLRLLPPDFDGTEIICSPSELAAYNKLVSEGHNKQ